MGCKETLQSRHRSLTFRRTREGRRSAFLGLMFGSLSVSAPAQADDGARWNAPFGGAFSANVTVASDYSFAGISQTKRSPAFQMGLDYKTAEVSADVPLWLYLTVWGSNIDFPTTGSGVEIDVSGGLKFLGFDKKLSVDFGYIRYSFPGTPAELGYDYGEINFNVGYDFGMATLAGRVRFSPHSFGDSGNSWNKRALLTIPLPFLRLSEIVSFKAYGSLGNFQVERFQAYGIPSSDYWYWQVGLITTAFGLDFNVAYTDTSIEPSGCGNTNYCAGRVLVSVTKVF
jgi:uncharacterized protein (TIGR02001 family)